MKRNLIESNGKDGLATWSSFDTNSNCWFNSIETRLLPVFEVIKRVKSVAFLFSPCFAPSGGDGLGGTYWTCLISSDQLFWCFLTAGHPLGRGERARDEGGGGRSSNRKKTQAAQQGKELPRDADLMKPPPRPIRILIRRVARLIDLQHPPGLTSSPVPKSVFMELVRGLGFTPDSAPWWIT